METSDTYSSQGCPALIEYQELLLPPPPCPGSTADRAAYPMPSMFFGLIPEQPFSGGVPLPMGTPPVYACESYPG